jgi:hypothetical protein
MGAVVARPRRRQRQGIESSRGEKRERRARWDVCIWQSVGVDAAWVAQMFALLTGIFQKVSGSGSYHALPCPAALSPCEFDPFTTRLCMDRSSRTVNHGNADLLSPSTCASSCSLTTARLPSPRAPAARRRLRASSTKLKAPRYGD